MHVPSEDQIISSGVAMLAYQCTTPCPAGKSVKSWKRRWFILKQNGYLYYYTDSSAKIEKGKIDVVEAANVAPYTEKTKGADPPPATLSGANAFVIVTKERVFTCVCEMQGENK